MPVMPLFVYQQGHWLPDGPVGLAEVAGCSPNGPGPARPHRGVTIEAKASGDSHRRVSAERQSPNEGRAKWKTY